MAPAHFGQRQEPDAPVSVSVPEVRHPGWKTRKHLPQSKESHSEPVHTLVGGKQRVAKATREEREVGGRLWRLRRFALQVHNNQAFLTEFTC